MTWREHWRDLTHYMPKATEAVMTDEQRKGVRVEVSRAWCEAAAQSEEGDCTTGAPERPEPDSAEWWRQVAQGLGVEVAQQRQRAEQAEQRITALLSERDRLDCTRREGCDTRHCRVDAKCLRCRLEQAERERDEARASAVPECMHGHRVRQAGCVSCVLVFDKPPAAPPVVRCVACTEGNHTLCLGGRCECIHTSSPPPETGQREALVALYELAGETLEGARRLGTKIAMVEARLQQARAALASPAAPERTEERREAATLAVTRRLLKLEAQP